MTAEREMKPVTSDTGDLTDHQLGLVFIGPPEELRQEEDDMRLRNPSRRVGALTAILAATWLQVAGPALTVAAVVPPIDFGTIGVGNTASASYELPLTYGLSQLPPDTLLYAGGDPAIDSVLAFYGISVPVTAGSLYEDVGEITATYHLILGLGSPAPFSVSAPDCGTATASCAVTVTFAPAVEGSFADMVSPAITDLKVTGSSSFADLIDLMGPYLADQVEPELAVAVSGAASTGTSGLELRVSVQPEAAPCVLLDAASIDFGTLPFSTEAQLSEGSGGVTVSSCSTGSQAIYANGTDATGDAVPAAQWALSAAGGNPCAGGVNQYGVSLGTDGSGGMPASFQLSTLSSSWIVMQAGANVASMVAYQMPCTGSDGAGQTMSSLVTFLATVP